MKKLLSDPLLIFGMAFTLGLAPFFPEPHVWGKIKWVAGGANGMQLMDWFDLLMHGAPWVLVIIWTVNKLTSMFKMQPKT